MQLLFSIALSLTTMLTTVLSHAYRQLLRLRLWSRPCAACGTRTVTSHRHYAGAEGAEYLAGVQYECRRCGHSESWRD